MESYPDQANRITTGQINGMSAKTAQQGELSELIRRFRGRTKDLEDRINQLEEVKSRLMPFPVKEPAGGENKHDSGLLPEFAAQLDHYEYLIVRLNGIIEDLQQAV